MTVEIGTWCAVTNWFYVANETFQSNARAEIFSGNPPRGLFSVRLAHRAAEMVIDFVDTLVHSLVLQEQ